MDRPATIATTPVVRWRWVGVAIYLALNVGLILSWEPPGPHNGDWQLWTNLPGAIERGAIYDIGPLPFVWSVPAAYLMAGVSFLGYWPWFALHFAAVGLLWRTPLLAVLMAASWPLWVDAAEGNTFAFIAVVGVLAVNGSRAGGIAYLVLCALIPRPVQLPLALWLVWSRPDLRIPALAAGAVVLAASIGQVGEWAHAVRAYEPPFNMSPTHFFGPAWWVVGLPLAAWLSWRGKLGLAGLAISPYVMPYYLLVAVFHTPRRDNP